jgi:chromate reductase, NAD(P)H dehydrogenase (quinone)
VIVLPDQLAISKAHEAFDENGNLKDSKQKDTAILIGKTLAETTAKLAGLPSPALTRS